MRPLLALSGRWASIVFVTVLGVGVAAGGVRLLPWLVAEDVPWRISGPFARVLLATAVEVAVLSGVPIGAAVGAALFVERGEARALLSLGARPERLVAELSLAGILVVALSAAASRSASVLSMDAEPPGRFASRLLAEGRAACDEAARARVDVPLAALTWLCFAPGPRLAGRIPGLPAPVWFSSARIELGDELRSVQLVDLNVAGKLGQRAVHLHAARARVVGLSGWGGSRRVSGGRRGAVLAAGAVVTALFAVWSVISGGISRPLVAGAIAATAAVAMLACVRALDDRALPLVAYSLVPLVGIVVDSAGFFAARRFLNGRVAWRRAG